MKYTFTLIILFPIVLFSQETETKSEREKFPTSFAIQVRGLANNRIIEAPFELNNGTALSTLSMRNGFSIGGIIQRRFTDNLGIELGINHNKRYYDLSGTVLSNNTTYSEDFAFTNYELPINGLVFVRLSRQFHASAGLGFSTIFKPSSVMTTVIDKESNRRFIFNGFADKSKFNFNINGQFGFEYRTDKKGTFYFGGSTSIPTAALFEFVSFYSDLPNDIESYQNVNVRSPYFTIDLRYYFPKINNKGVQPNKGPIE